MAWAHGRNVNDLSPLLDPKAQRPRTSVQLARTEATESQKDSFIQAKRESIERTESPENVTA